MRSEAILIIVLVTCTLNKGWQKTQEVYGATSHYADITLSSVSGSQGQMCSIENFYKCLGHTKDLTNVATKAQLESACINFKEALKCADRHMKRCFGQLERQVFNHVLGGARDLIGELCVSGKVQDDFLRHAQCYSNDSKQTDSCTTVSQKLARISESVDNMEDAEKGLKRTCCTYRNFVQCKNELMIRRCGTEAGSFHEKHVNKISDPLIHMHCSSIILNPEDCLSIESLQSNRSNFFVISPSTTLIFATNIVSLSIALIFSKVYG